MQKKKNQINYSEMKASFVTPIMQKIAEKLAVKIQIEPKYRYVGQIILKNGEKKYFRNTNFDLNLLGASEIARDKAYASYFMKLLGYPVPEGQEFFTNKWAKTIKSTQNPLTAYYYAKKLGFPVIVKPNTKSQGNGVIKVYNKREFIQAVNKCNDNVFLVQRVITGNDYRIVVLDDQVISAYLRTPLNVIGDGKNSIQKLFERKQKEFKEIGRDIILSIEDIRIILFLKHLGFSKNSIPKKGECVQLLISANLSTGGGVEDVTKQMHPQWKKFAIQLTRDMGLRYCGIDVICQGTLNELPHSFIILEINAAPGLDNYALIGKKQKDIVEKMYTKVFKAMLR